MLFDCIFLSLFFLTRYFQLSEEIIILSHIIKYIQKLSNCSSAAGWWLVIFGKIPCNHYIYHLLKIVASEGFYIMSSTFSRVTFITVKDNSYCFPKEVFFSLFWLAIITASWGCHWSASSVALSIQLYSCLYIELLCIEFA